ncbi:phage tail tape measure protein [Mangrovibacillus sp. Mu-81]|uniref:phage tail tape measure protein n=1 Tax=Mangrovibacillus sp. Mu-81 TaxID=3121478 RepID=UPI002FE495F6
MSNVGEIRAKLTLNMDSWSRSSAKAKGDMKGLSTSAKQTSKDLGTIGRASAAAGAALAIGIGSATKVAADFQQKLKDVEAVSGSSASQMAELAEVAKELGKSTSFSSTQVLTAAEELIKAGLTMEQVIGGGLKDSLDLAVAGNLDLAKAAEIASVALNSFKDDNLSVADAANILAGAANASATDVSEMQFGLSQVSAVAAGAGLEFRDVSIALAAFAQNGLKGSDAGTSLKTMLQNLQPRTKEQISLFKELGLMTEEGANNFYDLNGEIKSMDQIAELLQTSLKDMTDQQRAFALETIFGSDAVRAGNILYREGAEGLNTMWDAMSKVTAADVAATKMDTFNGAVTELQSSLESLGIEVGGNFLELFTQIVRESTDIVRALADIDATVMKAGLAFAGTSVSIALVISAVGKLGIALRGLAMGTGPIGLAVVSLAVLGGALAAAKVGQSDFNKVTLEGVDEMEKSRLTLQGNIAEYDTLKAKSKLSSDELARFVDINSELTKTANPETINRLGKEQEYLYERSGLSNEELDRLVKLNGEIIEAVPESNTVLSAQGNILLENTSAAKEFNNQQIEMIRLELEAKKTKLEANMKGLLQDEKRIVSEINDEKRKMIDLDKQEADQLTTIGGIEEDLKQAKKDKNEAEAQQLTFNLSVENLKLQKIRDQKAEVAGTVLERSKELDKIQQEIGKLDAVKQRMVEIELKQSGINAKRGTEMQTLENELTNLYKQKAEMDGIKDAASRNTEEYRNAKKEIDAKISKLEGVRSKIAEIIGNADTLNSKLGADIRKRVFIEEIGGARSYGNNSEQAKQRAKESLEIMLMLKGGDFE